MSVYNTPGQEIANMGGGGGSINAKIIAHRGYHATAKQNTVAAMVAAANAGFDWVEIDIRKTADGIYVLAHDATVTLYNNGTSTSVTIASANYSTIKNYTWDSAGQYPLATLQAVFNAMKIYDMKMILDRKSGTNAEIMELASMSGAVDRVMLSYSNFGDAVADVDLLQKYDNVPIRVWPSGWSNYQTLQGEISNAIYADINATSVNNTSISLALACGTPIIFSGCKTDNKNIWTVLASGCMANLDINISHDDFVSALTIDYDKAVTITPSVQSVSISGTGTSTVTAQSDLDAGGGYVYAYTLNPAIATAKQTSFGKSISVTVTGVSAGITTLRLFTGSGEIKDIPVTVT